MAVLHAWELVKGDIDAGAKKIGLTFFELVELHAKIWKELIGEKILPLTAKRDALAYAVNSHNAVDVNLKLFEVLGRIAIRGMWVLWEHCGLKEPRVVEDPEVPREAFKLARHIVELINNNHVLRSPITDAQAVDITCALMFLSMMKPWRTAAQDYCSTLLNTYMFNFTRHFYYPSIHQGYQGLIRHPQDKTKKYRAEHTKGSSIIPVIMLWGALDGKTEATEEFADFVKSEMEHCHQQLWLPGNDTEASLYTGKLPHGLALGDIPITADGYDAWLMLERECSADGPHTELSAVKLEHWPIVVMACRFSRLPIPPQLWFPLLSKKAER